MAIYINGVTLKKSKFGIRFSGKADEFISQLREHTNEKGCFNLEINERKEAGKYGETHYIKVDEWKPDGAKSDKITPNTASEPTDDLPF